MPKFVGFVDSIFRAVVNCKPIFLLLRTDNFQKSIIHTNYVSDASYVMLVKFSIPDCAIQPYFASFCRKLFQDFSSDLTQQLTRKG